MPTPKMQELSSELVARLREANQSLVIASMTWSGF